MMMSSLRARYPAQRALSNTRERTFRLGARMSFGKAHLAFAAGSNDSEWYWTALPIALECLSGTSAFTRKEFR